MPKLANLTLNPPKILLWGPPGSGKTALGLTLGTDLLALDLDDGLQTGLTLDDKFKPDRLEVEVKQFLEKDPSKAIAYQSFKAEINNIANQLRSGTFPHKAIMIDSFTQLADMARRYVAQMCGKMDSLGMKIFEKSRSGAVYPAYDMKMWGFAIDELKNIFRFVKSFPCVVITTFHEKTITVDEGDSEYDKKAISIFGRNLPADICSLFDEIIYMQRVTKIPRLRTISNREMENRTRTQLPDGTEASLGMVEILKLMNYNIKETPIPNKAK